MKKHFLLTCALVAMATSAVGAIVPFASPLFSGQEGPGTIYYELNTVTKEATVVRGKWEYTGTVVIPAEVEYENEPYMVTTIGKGGSDLETNATFYYCYALNEVLLGANVKTIRTNAFYRCGSKDVPVMINFDSDGLEVIESNAIREVVLKGNADGGKTLLFGKNIRQLGPDAATSTSNWNSWGGMYKITAFKVADGNTALSTDANGVLYNADKTILISYPKYKDDLTTYEIPATVTTVRSYAFHNINNDNKQSNTKLISVTGGANVMRLGSVISGTITSFHMGAKLTTMESTAFMYTAKGFIPDIDNANPTFKLSNNNALIKYTDSDVILCWYLRFEGQAANYVMPAEVTQIGNYAFYSNEYIKTIDFANANTKLTSSKIGSESFLSTKYSVEFLNAEGVYTNVDGIWYTDDLKKMIVWGGNVDIVNYVMPEQTTSIPRSAVKNNGNVKTIAINKNFNSTDPQNYYLWNCLESYSVDPDNTTFWADDFGVLYKGTKLISYPRGNTRAYYKIANGTTQIGTYAFYSNKFLKVLDLGSSITSVVEGNCSNLAAMEKLEAIKVATMTPPTVTTSSFSQSQLTSGKIKLYIPLDDGAYDIYHNASIWNKFAIVRDTSEFLSDMLNIDIEYVVNNYRQNVDDDEYSFYEANNKTGKMLSTTTEVGNTYEGFTPQTDQIEQIVLDQTGLSLNIYYNRNIYTVAWVNGATPVSSDTYKYGAKFVGDKPADPTPVAGKHFLGWNTDANASTALIFNNDETVKSDVTYYAIFADNDSKSYVVKHYQENLDGTYPTEPNAVDMGSGSFGAQTVAIARNFEGFTAQDFNQKTIAEDGSTVVEILYNRNTHTLTWGANKGTLAGTYTTGTVKYGTNITEPTATRTGYTFFGWGETADATSTVTTAVTMPDANLSYYAIWHVNQYRAVWYLNNGTNAEFTGSLHDYNTAITAPFGTPNAEDYDEYHDFLGWAASENGAVITNGNFGVMTTEGAKFYAIWRIHSNTLAWDSNGGNALTGNYTNGTVDYGTIIVKPTNPTRAGHTFLGWATSPNGTPEPVLPTMPDNNMTYYAIWQINSHNITWNTNGGEALTGDYTSGSVNYGTTITKPADPTRYGHDFKGWAAKENPTLADVTTPATTMPDNDLTYYAVWDAHKHNLKWYPNGGEFTNGDPSGLVAFGTAIEMPMVNRTDWKMAGWATSANATPNDVETPAQTMPDNDLTYYAIWILKTNYVTWKRNYSENDDANFTATPVEVGNAITAPSGAPTREHYQFIGWSATRDGDVITDGNYGTMDENKKEFYARWELNKNTLTWDANGGTIVTSGTTGLVEYGAAITEPTVERNGYTFKGWGATAAATENDAVETTTMPDAATTYYAIWSANAYDVTWMKNDGTNEITTVTQVAFDSEIQAPSENPAREHYRFIGWAATPEGEVTADFGTLTTEGATFYAKWELRKYTLGWDANDGELSGDYTPAGDVEYGTPIVVPTATRTNYIHAGWGTSVKPDSSVNITTMPDSAVTYVAIWTNDNIEWRYNFEPDGNYTATTANIGEQIVPPVDPERPNYQFLGWSDAADGDIITDFGTMDSDHKIFYAQWQIHSNTLTWNANGGELSGDYTQGSVEFGTEIVRPVAEREGYTFNGWNTFAEAVDSISISTMPDNDVEYFAVWKVNKYAIAWMMNNGTDSVFATANVNYADTIKAPQTQPERTDYNFKGWAATETGSAIDSFGLMPAANTTFYAVWAANLFDAYWMVNDGTQAVFATTQASVSTTLVAPDSIPSRAYYTFKGWSTTATGEPMSNIEMPEGGITLYAVWASNEFTAIWKMNDGTDNNFETMKVEMGQTITAPAKNPTRQYYEFVGWSKTAQGSVTTDFGTMTADGAEFFAIWDAIVEFNAPETFVTCEREQNIELGGLSNKEIKFTWKVNDKVDATQTGTTFDIPEDAAFSGTITVTGSFGGKDVTKTITYQRKKMMTRTLWDDVITVANPDTTFVSYRWYHNGTLVDTTEYYNEVGGLTGKYYLIATTESGTEICSCESYFGGAQEATMTVYPNPTVDDVTVAGSLIEAGATISVIDGNGKEWLRKTVETDGSETVNVSQMPQGMYIVKVGDKVVSFIKL